MLVKHSGRSFDNAPAGAHATSGRSSRRRSATDAFRFCCVCSHPYSRSRTLENQDRPDGLRSFDLSGPSHRCRSHPPQPTCHPWIPQSGPTMLPTAQQGSTRISLTASIASHPVGEGASRLPASSCSLPLEYRCAPPVVRQAARR
jgi:hypothetical protein